ncbi:hypothetical protein ACWEVP_43785 [Amycolatopsis sp. NPDC003865]
MARDKAQDRIEGPVVEKGTVNLTGNHVAGHDMTVIYHGDPEEALPFLVVDREYLAEQARKPKRIYVARSPDWADVVHGNDPELRFIERDQTEALCVAVRDALLDPITRGTDMQLHSLFVLGAPGSGKTTLVRRVAAMLVMAGECVVADFGVKTERVTHADTTAYIRALDQLAAAGKPVLALVDDPFFANSGWVELLQALGKPQHQGIAVLGASPDFLFEKFAHWLFGKQVLGRTFDVSRPSVSEREQLMVLHGRNLADALSTDEDLLVVAMEATAGESFRDIMQRMWMTLNDGVPIDPTTEVRHLPWAVVAFAVTCFFHQNYVLCPEALLHEFLSDTLDETPPSQLAHVLQNLVTREGWRIFSVHTPSDGGRLIGATHARVAREAWQHRPASGWDVDKTVIDVSARVPTAVPQLAELILARKPAQVNQLSRRFSTYWSAAISDDNAETKTLCALVRALQPSRSARLNFRAVLRRCLTAQNNQSWLAAWQLYHLSSNELHPQERKFLLEIDLPWTLKIADLSAGPPESIDIARWKKELRVIIIDRLTTSLREDAGWIADARQVSWLLETLPAGETVSLLEPVYRWLENDLLTADDVERPSRAERVVEALVPMLSTDSLLDENQSARLLTVALEWLVTAPNSKEGVVRALLSFAETDAGGNEAHGKIVVRELIDWLCSCQENNETEWVAFFTTMERLSNAAELAPVTLPRALTWLTAHPEADEQIWRAMFGALAALRAFGHLPEIAGLAREVLSAAFTWLKAHPEANEQTWRTMVGTLGAFGHLPEIADSVRVVLPEAFDWLKARPEADEKSWRTLFGTLTTLGAYGHLPEIADAVRTVLPEAFTSFKSHPEASEQTWRTLFGTLTTLGAYGHLPEIADAVRTVLPEAFTSFKSHPEASEQTWRTLFGALAALRAFGHLPEIADLAREALPEAFTWLKAHPEADERTWRTVFTALGAFGHLPEIADLAREVLPEAFTSLKTRPEADEQTWRTLLAALSSCGPFNRVPEVTDLVGVVLPEAFAWLKAHPEADEETWRTLFGALSAFGPSNRIPEVTDLVGVVLPEAFAWLKAHPEADERNWRTIVGMAGSLGHVPGVADVAREVLPEAFTWLKTHPEANERTRRNILRAFGSFGHVPEIADLAREVLPEAFTWLKTHPEANERNWRAMLGTLVRVPEIADLARQVLPEAFTWLKAHPDVLARTQLDILVALSSPIAVSIEQRAGMLTTLRQVATDSDFLRGVRLLELANAAHRDLVPAVTSELTELENDSNRRLSYVLAEPMAFAVAKTGRADLVARFAAWKLRSLDSHDDDQNEVAEFAG